MFNIRWRRVAAWTGGTLLGLLLIGLVTSAIVLERYRSRADQFDLKQVGEIPQRSAVYDVNGELYSYLHGENRLIVPLDRVSKNFINALLAREDARFYEHHGLDYYGIARALVRNVSKGGVRQGASTITQQLARNSFKLRGRTYDRKLLEAMVAKRIERSFSKDQILEHYVNRIYFGAGLYGIETASKAYFGKPSSGLDVSESALLAGIIRGPNQFSPINNLDGALAQRDQVIDRMRDLKMIDSEEAERTKAKNLFVFKKRPLPFQENYAMDAVIRDLNVILDSDQIDFGGLKIFTTIDPALQKLAVEALQKHLDQVEQQSGYEHPKKADFKPASEEEQTPYLQGALIAIDNRNGGIRAIVGGRDFEQSKVNRALTAKRQIGSTFKPFVYASAFQRGLLPGTFVDDSEIRPGEYKTIKNDWSPENSDGEYLGLQPAAVGLVKSRNTMTVRIGELSGLNEIRRVAKVTGLSDDVPELPVIYLGAFESTLKDLTSAYTIFPNAGARRQSYIIARIDTADGRTIYKASHAELQALDRDSAWITSSLLEHVLKTGTAAKARSLGFDKIGAGKTGTTNDYKDAWFVGYTTSLTCGVWVGFDQPQTIMKKGYGSALALPIWVDFMDKLPSKQYPATAFNKPEKTRKVHLCSTSNAQANQGCDFAQVSYDVELPIARVPTARCTQHLAGVYAADPMAPVQPGQPVTAVGVSPATGAYQAPPPQSAAPAVAGRPVSALPPATSGNQPLPPAEVSRSGNTVTTVQRTNNGMIIYQEPATPARPRASMPREGDARPVPPLESRQVPVQRAEPVNPAPARERVVVQEPPVIRREVRRPDDLDEVPVMRARPAAPSQRRVVVVEEPPPEGLRDRPASRRVLRGIPVVEE